MHAQRTAYIFMVVWAIIAGESEQSNDRQRPPRSTMDSAHAS